MPTTCCATCGYRTHPDMPRRDRRRLVTVVDELGSAQVCDMCAIVVLGRGEVEVTLLLSRPGVQVAR